MPHSGRPPNGLASSSSSAHASVGVANPSSDKSIVTFVDWWLEFHAPKLMFRTDENDEDEDENESTPVLDAASFQEEDATPFIEQLESSNGNHSSLRLPRLNRFVPWIILKGYRLDHDPLTGAEVRAEKASHSSALCRRHSSSEVSTISGRRYRLVGGPDAMAMKHAASQWSSEIRAAWLEAGGFPTNWKKLLFVATIEQIRKMVAQPTTNDRTLLSPSASASTSHAASSTPSRRAASVAPKLSPSSAGKRHASSSSTILSPSQSHDRRAASATPRRISSSASAGKLAHDSSPSGSRHHDHHSSSTSEQREASHTSTRKRKKHSRTSEDDLHAREGSLSPTREKRRAREKRRRDTETREDAEAEADAGAADEDGDTRKSSHHKRARTSSKSARRVARESSEASLVDVPPVEVVPPSSLFSSFWSLTDSPSNFAITPIDPAQLESSSPSSTRKKKKSANTSKKSQKSTKDQDNTNTLTTKSTTSKKRTYAASTTATATATKSSSAESVSPKKKSTRRKLDVDQREDGEHHRDLATEAMHASPNEVNPSVIESTSASSPASTPSRSRARSRSKTSTDDVLPSTSVTNDSSTASSSVPPSSSSHQFSVSRSGRKVQAVLPFWAAGDTDDLALTLQPASASKRTQKKTATVTSTDDASPSATSNPPARRPLMSKLTPTVRRTKASNSSSSLTVAPSSPRPSVHWNPSELTELLALHSHLDASAPDFWHEIARQLDRPDKDAEECARRWTEHFAPTPNKPTSKTTTAAANKSARASKKKAQKDSTNDESSDAPPAAATATIQGAADEAQPTRAARVTKPSLRELFENAAAAAGGGATSIGSNSFPYSSPDPSASPPANHDDGDDLFNMPQHADVRQQEALLEASINSAEEHKSFTKENDPNNENGTSKRGRGRAASKKKTTTTMAKKPAATNGAQREILRSLRSTVTSSAADLDHDLDLSPGDEVDDLSSDSALLSDSIAASNAILANLPDRTKTDAYVKTFQRTTRAATVGHPKANKKSQAPIALKAQSSLHSQLTKQITRELRSKDQQRADELVEEEYAIKEEGGIDHYMEEEA